MMACPYCQGDATQDLERRTALGYRLFRCRPCRRTFNERTGTPFNHLDYPTDLVLLVVLWRLRYKLSLRDLAQMFLCRSPALDTTKLRVYTPIMPHQSHSIDHAFPAEVMAT